MASYGNAVLETQEDDSQSNLGWVDALGALCNRPSSDGQSVGLRLADLTLLFLAPNNTIQAQFGLSGQTLQQGFGWLTSTYSKVSGSAPPKPFALRDYEMSSHAVAQGTFFSLQNVAPYQELHHWYENTNAAIYDISSKWTQASPIRCWPHHFDLATLVTLDSGKGSEEARLVGCGMSPGDGTYNELGKISKEQRAGNWELWQTSLHNPDFAEYAKLCGALGISVRKKEELETALTKALAYDGPSLVEIHSDAELV